MGKIETPGLIMKNHVMGTSGSILTTRVIAISVVNRRSGAVFWKFSPKIETIHNKSTKISSYSLLTDTAVHAKSSSSV